MGIFCFNLINMTSTTFTIVIASLLSAMSMASCISYGNTSNCSSNGNCCSDCCTTSLGSPYSSNSGVCTLVSFCAAQGLAVGLLILYICIGVCVCACCLVGICCFMKAQKRNREMMEMDQATHLR